MDVRCGQPKMRYVSEMCAVLSVILYARVGRVLWHAGLQPRAIAGGVEKNGEGREDIRLRASAWAGGSKMQVISINFYPVRSLKRWSATPRAPHTTLDKIN